MKEIKGIKTYHENPLDFKKQTAIVSMTLNLHRWTGGLILRFAAKQWVNRGLPVAINYIHLI